MSHKPEQDRLMAGLEDEQREALGDAGALAQFLEGYAVPEPGPAGHARLMARLEPYLTETPARPAPSGLRHGLDLVRSQAALLEAPFWWSGGLVLLLGLALAMIDHGGFLAMAFACISPVLAAAGVAYAFRPATRGLWELEKISPVGPLELLYARLVLVLGLDLAFALVLLAVVWLQGPHVVVWRLALVWLGPMCALAGMALYATVRWSSVVGVVLPLGCWGTLVLLGWREAVLHSTELQSPTAWLLAQVSGSDAVMLTALLALFGGMLLLGQAGRLVSKGANQWD